MLPAKVKEFIQKHELLQTDDRVLVGYSGGADSTCLLLLTQELCRDMAAIYVNHRLRGAESEEEERFVRNFCAAHNVSLFVERMQWKRKPGNLEEMARRKRYRYFAKVAAAHGFTKVALAHNQNDAIETFLLRLFRGSGPLGLTGLNTRRGIYVRPLLGCTREEILDFLQLKNVAWFQDTSNVSLQFQRNRIRNDLIPYLEQHFNPTVRRAITRALQWLNEQNELNAELLKPFQKRIRVKAGRIILSRRSYLQLSFPLRKAVLRMALQKADPSLKLSSRLVARMNEAIEKSISLELPGFLLLKSTARTDRIEFSIKPERIGYAEVDVPHEGVFSYPAAQANLQFSVRQNNKFSTISTAAYLDAAKAAFPLHIRNWKKGDFFQPLGMKGHKKLSDFWIDRKVPRKERKRIPLIFKEEDLVWVAGYEIDHNYRVTENTKKVLCIELIKSDV